MVPPLLFYGGARISLFFQFEVGIASLYLPTATALVLINWWGPARVLPALYLNAAITTPLWGIPEPAFWLVCAVPETVYILLSWLIFTKRLQGDFTLPNYHHLSLFLIFGIIIPLAVGAILLDAVHFVYEGKDFVDFDSKMLRNFVGEFTSGLGFAIPALYFGTPRMERWKLVQIPRTGVRVIHKPLSGKQLAEALLIYAGTIILSFFVSFEDYWFVDGIFALYMANRFGFGAALFANLLALTFTYIVPVVVMQVQPSLLGEDLLPISLGNSLLFIFAAVTGRVITDLRQAEQKLKDQNHELETTNRELDRFVYSTSHDLSSPLKSILGLINISRLDPDPKHRMDYLGKMEASVRRLEIFIRDVLDYSRVNRLETRREPVNLKELCEEIISQLQLPGQPAAEVDLSGLTFNEFSNDRLRIRIILNNLISNAWKFRKADSPVPHQIRIRSAKHGTCVRLEVADNGDGIKPEHQSKIFDLFFRGTHKHSGSGLGLYIVKEAVEKLGGSIAMESTYGEGTTFSVKIPIPS